MLLNHNLRYLGLHFFYSHPQTNKAKVCTSLNLFSVDIVFWIVIILF